MFSSPRNTLIQAFPLTFTHLFSPSIPSWFPYLASFHLPTNLLLLICSCSLLSNFTYSSTFLHLFASPSPVHLIHYFTFFSQSLFLSYLFTSHFPFLCLSVYLALVRHRDDKLWGARNYFSSWISLLVFLSSIISRLSNNLSTLFPPFIYLPASVFHWHLSICIYFSVFLPTCLYQLISVVHPPVPRLSNFRALWGVLAVVKSGVRFP